MSEDESGDLECVYKACQAAITDGGLFTDTGLRCQVLVSVVKESDLLSGL